MTNKELIEILHNIPQEIFQNKNHDELRLIFHCEEPKLKLFTLGSFEVLTLTLYESMQYRVMYEPAFKDIANQVESYLNILGFTENPPTLYSASRSPNLGVVISSTMTDTEIINLIQSKLGL
jgi:hypothetical protein